MSNSYEIALNRIVYEDSVLQSYEIALNRTVDDHSLLQSSL